MEWALSELLAKEGESPIRFTITKDGVTVELENLSLRNFKLYLINLICFQFCIVIPSQ